MRAVLVASLPDLFAKQKLADRFGESALNRPSVTQSITDGLSRYPKTTAPLRNRHRLTTIGEVVILSCVAVLLRDCRPTAILRRVRSVIIDTVYRASVRTLAHVGKEAGERLAPSGTDGNATRPISLVRFVARGVASRNHLAISVPQVMSRVPMRRVVFSRCIGAQAAAASCFSCGNFRAFYLAVCTAVALAVPDCAAAFIQVRERDDSQAAKPLTGNVFDARAELRGMIRLHREPPKFSVTWAGTLARRRPTCLFTSPLYHIETHSLYLYGAWAYG